MNSNTTSLTFPTGANRNFSPDALARLEKMDAITRLSHYPWKDGSAVFDPDLNDALRSTTITMERKQEIINENWMSMTKE